MPAEPVTLGLSESEVLVLFEFLTRTDRNETLIVEDQAERVVLVIRSLPSGEGTHGSAHAGLRSEAFRSSEPSSAKRLNTQWVLLNGREAGLWTACRFDAR